MPRRRGYGPEALKLAGELVGQPPRPFAGTLDAPARAFPPTLALGGRECQSAVKSDLHRIARAVGACLASEQEEEERQWLYCWIRLTRC